MKKITNILMGACVMCTLTLSAQAENLISVDNAGFEVEDSNSNAGIQGWTADPTSVGFFSRETAQVNSGNGSLKVVVPADNSTLAAVAIKNTGDKVSFTAGDKCKFSCYVYIDGAKDAKLKSIVFALTGNGYQATPAITASPISKDGWVKIESSELTVANTHAEYLGYIKLNLDKTKAEELVMYLDDIELTKVVEEPVDPDGPEVPTSQNAGFEVAADGTACGAAGWMVSNDPGEGHFTRTTEQKYHGEASMKMNLPEEFTEIKNYYLQSTDVTSVSKDKKYKISCWVYIEKLGQLKSLYLVFGNMLWTQTEVNVTELPSNEWVKIESTEWAPVKKIENVVTPSDGTVKTVIKPQIYSEIEGDKEILIYIDNVAVNKVADAATSLENLNQSDLCVCGSQGALRIANVLVGDKVTIYNTTGQLVNTTIATSSNLSIPLQSGIYIVRVGAEARKVTL